MKRPEVEEFKRLTSRPSHAWGMADLDVVHLCDYILHLEAQNASMRRTFGSDPIFNEKQAEIGRLRAALAEQDDFILKFTAADRNGDWACVQCKPHSDMIKEGFVCGYHRAEARATGRQLANGPHDHDHL